MSWTQVLDFEKPIVELEEQLDRTRALVESGELSLANEVEKLEKKLDKTRTEVYKNLSAIQRVRLSRHFDRPFTMDYINRFITGFTELHGDRLFGEDAAIIAGIGKFRNQPVAIIGHQRGRTTEERIMRNFGMPNPEGYRKAQRISKMAERFELPLLLFIDTQGAFPGLEGEERGQAEAIANSLIVLSGLRTPIISIVIGEGGSGGALALGICDRLLMLENSTYSVITPEGCAAILWGKDASSDSKDGAGKAAENAKNAAESLQLTAQALSSFSIADEIIKEPVGGAHRDHTLAAELVEAALGRQLSALTALAKGESGKDELLKQRYQKFRNIGALNN
jgi:acetyl-CoA carboxylase carboxyl transferase subunit alpha